jgi:hypothetical protein
MTPVRIRPAAAALAVALTALAATNLLDAATAIGASGSKPLPQRLTLFSASVRGKDAPIVVQAAGPIRGLGIETQTEKNTANGQINYATLHLPNGTVRLVAPEKFVWRPDFRSCSATASGGGTFTITGGTGAYRRASGKGTFTSNGVMIGARDSHGNCLAKTQPTINYVTVTLIGTAATGS